MEVDRIRTAFLIDPGALSIDQSEAKRMNLERIPFHVASRTTGKEFINPDSRLQELYTLQKRGEVFVTSRPSDGDFRLSLEGIHSSGFNRVFVISIADGLSNTYQGAHAVAEEMMSNPIYADLEIITYNSGTLCHPLKDMVYRAVELSEQPTEEIINGLDQLKGKNAIYLLGNTNTLNDVSESGRFNGKGIKKKFEKAALQALALLKIRPIFRFPDENGEIELVGMDRLSWRVEEKFLSILVNDFKKGIPVKWGMLYSGDKDHAEELHKKMIETFSQLKGLPFLGIDEVGTPLGCHIGEGSVGVSIIYQSEFPCPEDQTSR